LPWLKQANTPKYKAPSYPYSRDVVLTEERDKIKSLKLKTSQLKTFNMKKDSNQEMDDDLRPEYDLTQLLKGGVRGKYAERYRAGTNLVLLAPDVAHAFPTEEAVNQALRLVLQLAKIPTGATTSPSEQ
jgi:hypothetical protein